MIKEKEIKELINKHSFKFKKRFGQNFLTDSNTLNKIVNSATIDTETLVIEVGTGLGILTKELSTKAKRVITYEIDQSLRPLIEDYIMGINNISIIYDDFLKRDVSSDLKKYKYNNLVLVSNLPYYITTPIITKVIEEKLNISQLVIMIQDEVANRLTAVPGTKIYNSLSIFMDYYFNVEKLFNVSKNFFVPSPKVESAVMKLSRREVKKVIVDDEDKFFKLVRDSFKYKRKTIKNNLKGYDLNKIEGVLIKNGYSLSSRAEEIPIEVYSDIVNKLK